MSFNELLKVSGFEDDGYHKLLASLVEHYKPKSILELGVRFGSTAIAMGVVCPPDIPITLIDPVIKTEAVLFMDKFDLKPKLIEGEYLEELPKITAEFVHIDPDLLDIHIFSQLFTISKWELQPQVIVIHSTADPEIKLQILEFMASNLEKWDVAIVTNVVNGAMVLIRRDDESQ